MPHGDSARQRLEQEYLAAFLPHGYVPVMVPRDQSVGDVIASLDGNFIARADECFTNLAPRSARGNLPTLTLSWDAAAQLALGLDAIASAEAHGNAADQVQITFENVTVRSASLMQLRAQLRPKVMPELTVMLAAQEVSFDGVPDWLLISEVVSAVSVVRVQRARGGGARADLSFLERLFGGKAKATVGGDLASAELAEIRTAEPLPVAFRPARVRVTAEIAGSFRAASSEAFNPHDEAHRRALEAWAQAAVLKVHSTPVRPVTDPQPRPLEASPAPTSSAGSVPSPPGPGKQAE